MTTIVYDFLTKTLAADRIIHDGTNDILTDKIIERGENYYVGAGVTSQIQQHINNIIYSPLESTETLDSSVLVINKDSGDATLYTGGSTYPVIVTRNTRYVTLGDGGAIALTALEHGVNIKVAVGISQHIKPHEIDTHIQVIKVQ